MRLHIARPGIIVASLATFLLGWALPGLATTLQVLPGTSSPGAEVLVRGADYPAGDTIHVQLVATDGSGDADLGSGDADDIGLLFERMTIPDVPPGDYRVTAQDSRGTTLATANHTVGSPPPMRLSPDLGAPGTPVTVDFGPVPPGYVEIRYDGIPVLGPVAHAGGLFSEIFRVPADRPVPLGSTVQVKAIAKAGGNIAGVAEADFLSRDPGPQDVTLSTYSGAGEPLSDGEPFAFSGQLNLPSNRNPADYRLTLVVVALDGRLIPTNTRVIPVASDGSFSGEAVFPSLVSGSVLAAFGTDPQLGLVYKNANTGESGFLPVQPEQYEGFEVQTLKFHVYDSEGPVEDAVINVYANTKFVPPTYDYEKQGLDFLLGSSDSESPTASQDYQKPTWSALYAQPNQYYEGIQEIKEQTNMITNPITECPVTLNQGLTNAAGNFEVSVLPILNWLFDKAAQSTSQLDINTSVLGPGKATFTVHIQGVHLGLGYNADGVCGGVRYEFQYDYDTGLWNLRNGPDGPFDIPFDPDTTQETFLPECGVLETSIPADPYMPGLPAKEVTIMGDKAPRFGALWSFPNTEALLIVEKIPQLRLPHLSSAFGLLEDTTLFLDNVEIGPLDVQGALCGGDGIEYVIDLPQLVTYPPGIVAGRIEASMLGGTPVSEHFEIDVRPGPTWLEQPGNEYENRRISWKPEQVTLVADEPVQDQSANAAGIPYDVGDLDNDNMTSARVTQSLLPSGAASRTRMALSDSTAANEDSDEVQNNASANGSSPSNGVPFGSMDPITVLDTGLIPLFRYAWGIWPIASATIGADIWFKALYRYFGEVIATNSQVVVDFVSEAIALAGLDLWFDLSIIFDVVSITAYALPNFGLAMPLVVDDNQFDATASKPCFNFALDIAYSVAVGWCPFCIKAGGDQNLFTEAAPADCEVPGVGAQVAQGTQGITIPEIPAIDRTSIAVDGYGETTVVFGAATGMLNVQSMEAGQAVQIEQVPAGPGAMAPDIAYLGPDFRVMVWAKSGLLEDEFYALGDDILAAAQYQQLVYRVDDGSGWSETMELTSPTTGDGGVVLAACPSTDPACPSGGEILAVWVHDPAGNIGMHDMKLRYAYFDGALWTAPQDVDPGSTYKDIQPSATYLDGDPVVFWVRDPSVVPSGDMATFDLNQRYIAYRFLRQAAGVQEPTTLPTGVASPVVQAFGTNALALAFSKATDPESFIGTRRSLHTAYGTLCSAGSCNFGSAVERRDGKDRRIFVERPQLARNPQGQGVLTFRQLGTDAPLPGDPQGVLNHSGALMQLVVEFDAVTPDPVGDPFQLNTGGGVNWKVDSVYDPASNAVLTTAVSVEQQALQQESLLAGTTSRTQSGTGGSIKVTRLPASSGQAEGPQGVGGSPVVLIEQPALPDFELLDARLEQSWIPDGTSVELTVTLRNNGSPWEDPEDLQVATYWDGPPGLGQTGPTLAIADLESGKPVDFTLDVPLPPGFHEDDSHDLYVVVNPNGGLEESNATDNQAVLDVGDLPVPMNLTVADGDASGIIVVHWDPVIDDPRVTGYRVYRRNPDDSILIVGSSGVGGFADFSVYPEQHYQYFVTSHSARLIESEPSEEILTSALVNPDEIFRDSFETTVQ